MMRRGLLFLAAIFLLISFQVGFSQNTEVVRIELFPSSFNLDEKRDKFKYSDLDSFKMDNLGWDERDSIYHRLTHEEFYQVYRDTTLPYSGEYQHSIDLDFYYSTENRFSQFQEITVLWQREGINCEGIDYLLFDLDGKLIDKFLVAGGCGDGGYIDEKYGRFTNDSTYILRIEEIDDTANNQQKGFSTQAIFERTYRITQFGKINIEDKIISQDTIKF